MNIIRGDRIDKIVVTIRSWNPGHSKLVIAVDGYSGSGKSTLLKQLEEHLAIVPLSIDDFVYDFPHRRECVNLSINPEGSLPECWYRLGDLETIVRAFRNRQAHAFIRRYDYNNNAIGAGEFIDLRPDILIIEGIFIASRLRRQGLADRTIFLLADYSEAENRREARERTRWGQRYQPESHPESYVRLFRKAFNLYLEKERPLEDSDLIVLNYKP